MVSDPGSRNGSDHRRPGAPTRGDRSHMKPHDQPARLLSNHLLRHALCCGPGCRGFESPRSPHAIQGLTCRFEGSPEFVANQMVSILVKQVCVMWIKCSLVARSRPLRATYATRWSFISRAWLVLAGGLVPSERAKSGVGSPPRSAIGEPEIAQRFGAQRGRETCHLRYEVPAVRDPYGVGEVLSSSPFAAA